MGFPYKRRTERVEDPDDRRTDLGPDAVTRNEGCWYRFLFIGLHASLQETYETAFLAKSESNVSGRVMADRVAIDERVPRAIFEYEMATVTNYAASSSRSTNGRIPPCR